MKKVEKNIEIRHWKGEIPVYFLYTAGVAGERFFQGLKEGKLLASRCPQCGKRYIPPRIYCEECLSEIEGFFEVEPLGTVESFTEVYLTSDEKRLKEPVLLVLTRIEGTDCALLLKGLGKVKMGDRVKVVFEEERKGRMEDIKGVEPLPK